MPYFPAEGLDTWRSKISASLLTCSSCPYFNKDLKSWSIAKNCDLYYCVREQCCCVEETSAICRIRLEELQKEYERNKKDAKATQRPIGRPGKAMPPDTEVPVHLRKCYDCPHCNHEDTQWDEDRSDYNVYCLLKEKYCIENMDDEICLEREKEIESRYRSLDDMFPAFRKQNLTWLDEHDFIKTDENNNAAYYMYDVLPFFEEGRPAVFVDVILSRTGAWCLAKLSVCKDGEKTVTKSGHHRDVRECILELQPAIDDAVRDIQSKTK